MYSMKNVNSTNNTFQVQLGLPIRSLMWLTQSARPLVWQAWQVGQRVLEPSPRRFSKVSAAWRMQLALYRGSLAMAGAMMTSR
eukprot:COSAG01_NODE_302_length_19206_cov_11.098687_9_plen_83_part_00